MPRLTSGQLLSVSAASFEWSFTILIGGTIITTYILYVLEGNTPIFLPTISSTWISPPGNYLSRLVVSLTCSAMSLSAVVKFWSGTADRRSKEERGGGMAPLGEVVTQRTLLLMALIGILCFSGVGAVCDSTAPTCRGDSTLHTTLAVIFFVLYDLYLIIIIAEGQGRNLEKRFSLALCFAFGSVGTKIRWFLPEAFPGTALFEWADVFCILVADVSLVVSRCGKLSVALLKQDEGDGHLTKDKQTRREWMEPLLSEPSTESVLTFLSCRQLTLAAIFMSVLASIGGAFIGMETGVVPVGELPVMSDTWWQKPGNWLARWAVPIGCTFLHVGPETFYWGKYKLAQAGTFRLIVSPEQVWQIGFVGSFFLSIVGCVSEKENPDLHSVAAAVWGVGYDLFMLFTLANAIASPELRYGGWGVTSLHAVALLVSVLSKLRWTCPYGMSESFDADVPPWCATTPQGTSLLALYEWADIIAVWTFLVSTVVVDPASKSLGLAIVENQDTPEELYDGAKGPTLVKGEVA